LLQYVFEGGLGTFGNAAFGLGLLFASQALRDSFLGLCRASAFAFACFCFHFFGV
jgi:hypothetical protein